MYICPGAAKSSCDKFCGTGYLESVGIYSNVKIRYLIHFFFLFYKIGLCIRDIAGFILRAAKAANNVHEDESN